MVTFPLQWRRETEAKTETRHRLIPLISPKQEKANVQKGGEKPQSEDTAAGGDGGGGRSATTLGGAGDFVDAIYPRFRFPEFPQISNLVRIQ